MQEIRSSNTPAVTGIYDPSKSRARHHRRSTSNFLNDLQIHQVTFDWYNSPSRGEERLLDGTHQAPLLQIQNFRGINFNEFSVVSDSFFNYFNIIQ